MAEHKKRIGQNRAFLNEPYMTSLSSCISYTIVARSHNEAVIKEGLYDYTNIEFSISDCSRNIYLDFNIDNEEEMKNSLFKLDTIIETCITMKKDLKIARKEVLKGIKLREKLKEKEEKKNVIVH